MRRRVQRFHPPQLRDGSGRGLAEVRVRRFPSERRRDQSGLRLQRPDHQQILSAFANGKSKENAAWCNGCKLFY